MTTKEKVVRAAIKKASDRLNKVDFLLNARPASELVKLQMEMLELLKSNDTTEKWFSADAQKSLDSLVKREKYWKRIMKLTKPIVKLIDEQVKLRLEISDLKLELYFIERKNLSL